MGKNKQKLELTWIGKDDEYKDIEPRILVEVPEKSYGDKNTENMLIHGDNLLALKALEQDYTGKIKCIYIDPPYNTGSAFEHYDDNVEHSKWLSLMKSRLEILKNLLSEDGSIWITLDDNETHYCKILCDEIFSRKNFIADVIWNSRKSVSNDAIISLNTNHILVYAKDIDTIRILSKKSILFKGPINDSKFANPDNDPKGKWVADPFDAPNIRPNLTYEIVNPNTNEIYLPPKGRCWRTTEQEYKKFLEDGRIIFGKNGTSKPQLKRYFSEALGKGQVLTTLWSDLDTTTNATKHSQQLFDGNSFTNPKPENLIERVLTLGSNEGDLVLDSFLGSGTTAAVAHKMGRKWIGIELGNHCYTHCEPRLHQVVDGTDQGGISKAVNWQGGGGYKFYELAPSLLKKDEFDNWIIEPKYDAEMLAEAMAKHEGYKFSPDENNVYKQGYSTEKDFIFTTTQFLSVELLNSIHNKLEEDESLLICATHFEEGVGSAFSNITVKKIPQMLLNRCEFGRMEYNLNIIEEAKPDDFEEDEILEDEE